jgi:hypothetical protein
MVNAKKESDLLILSSINDSSSKATLKDYDEIAPSERTWK